MNQTTVDWREKENAEISMFGITVKDLRETIDNPMFGTKPSMAAMSYLSDAQTVLEMGNGKETARVYMNRAKFIISEYLTEKGGAS